MARRDTFVSEPLKGRVRIQLRMMRGFLRDYPQWIVMHENGVVSRPMYGRPRVASYLRTNCGWTSQEAMRWTLSIGEGPTSVTSKNRYLASSGENKRGGQQGRVSP